MYVNIDRLSKKWGTFGLKDVSLNIGKGKYFVLLGPCGAGKTMLLSAIAGLYRPDAGDIYIDDRNVTKLPPEKRGIGYLFQNNALFPHLGVRGNIYYGLRHKEQDKAYIKRVLDILSIQDILNRPTVTNLSGGEARKVALARCLVTKPRLLLLDEPLSFLDPASQKKVKESLVALNEDLGITVMHVTHHPSEVRPMADEAAVIIDGAIAETGKVSDIIDKPSKFLMQKFWGE